MPSTHRHTHKYMITLPESVYFFQVICGTGLKGHVSTLFSNLLHRLPVSAYNTRIDQVYSTVGYTVQYMWIIIPLRSTRLLYVIGSFSSTNKKHSSPELYDFEFIRHLQECLSVECECLSCRKKFRKVKLSRKP